MTTCVYIYVMTILLLLLLLQVDLESGMSGEEVERRRLAYGPNALKGQRSVHPLVLFLGHLFNVMTFILFMALALSLAVQEWIESGVIAFVIITNAIIG